MIVAQSRGPLLIGSQHDGPREVRCGGAFWSVYPRKSQADIFAEDIILNLEPRYLWPWWRKLLSYFTWSAN